MMYFTIGLYLGLIIVSILMIAPFFRGFRAFLSDLTEDTDLADLMNFIETGESFDKDINFGKGLIIIVFIFIIYMLALLVLYLICLLLWPAFIPLSIFIWMIIRNKKKYNKTKK